MAATPFASTADYTARGYDASVWGAGVLDVRLAAASRWLRAQCDGIDDRIATETLDLNLVVDVVCQMVDRTAPVEEFPFGMDSLQETRGPFSTSLKRTNPHGDFYLTKNEKRSLGCVGKAFSVDLLVNREVAG